MKVKIYISILKYNKLCITLYIKIVFSTSGLKWKFLIIKKSLVGVQFVLVLFLNSY